MSARLWRTLAVATLVVLLSSACAAPRTDTAQAPRATARATAPPAAPAASSAAGAPTSASTAGDTSASAVADFYRGKTLRFVTGFSAGGSFDGLTRVTARHLPKHLPGNPQIIVENMTGAGGLLAANHVYNVARKDGTALLNLDGGAILFQALERPGIEFDARRFNWLPSPAPDIQACWVTRSSGWGSIGEAMGSAREIVIGSTGPGSFPANNARILKASLGLPMRIIDGYAGIQQVRLASEQGEVDGACNAYESTKRAQAEQLASGDVKVIVQMGERPFPGLESVPNALDLAPSEQARRLLRLGIIAPNDVNRLFALPPGVPPERVAAMRAAMTATFEDPAFKEDFARTGLDLIPVSVERITEVANMWLNMTPDEKSELRTVLGF